MQGAVKVPKNQLAVVLKTDNCSGLRYILGDYCLKKKKGKGKRNTNCDDNVIDGCL